MNSPLLELTQDMVATLSAITDELHNFLQLNGITAGNKKLTTLVEAVKHLKVRLNDRPYAGLCYDSNGYIVRAFALSEFEEVSKLPRDVDGGYYKYIDGAFVVDEERKRQLGA